jgi:hypothetical protein
LGDNSGDWVFRVACQRLEAGAGQFRRAQKNDSQSRHADSQRQIAPRRKEKLWMRILVMLRVLQN